nr:MAG TPA: hypothetical protein [Caudoviricetes sp.]
MSASQTGVVLPSGNVSRVCSANTLIAASSFLSSVPKSFT